MNLEDNKNCMENYKFSGCIPLNHLFGFCEDCKKIIMNCNQQLILNRSSTDMTHCMQEVGADVNNDENNKNVC